MKKLQFPDKHQFDQFKKYIHLSNAQFDEEKLIVICIPDDTELQIARSIFNAEVIGDI